MAENAHGQNAGRRCECWCESRGEEEKKGEGGLETRKARYKPTTGLPRKRGRKRGGKVKTIAHNWHMKFKEARARRRGWKGQSLTQYTHATVFEPLFFSLPSSSLEIYISSLLELLNCLFIPLSFKEPLVAIPSPSSLRQTPQRPPPSPLLSNFIPISFPRLTHRFSFLSVPSLIAVCHEPAATSSSSLSIQRQSSIYGEITLRWPIIENMPSSNALLPSSLDERTGDSGAREREFFLLLFSLLICVKEKKRKRKDGETRGWMPRMANETIGGIR